MVNKTIKVKAGQSCALFINLDSASCSCSFNASKFPIPALKNAGIPQQVCSGKKIVLGQPKTNGYKYLWIPGTDFNSDTVAQPVAVIENTDTAAVNKKYVLTT